jgi:HD-GYP domain-containing protein (c-di-GMP phosphodiesterase class II)/DNA-binding CsgD family transcriptional regulator
VPLAELVGGLAMACDLANGFPPEKVLRTAIIAVEVARRADLGESAARDAYWVTLLRFLGCTGFAHEEAHLYGAGDDTQTRNVMAMADAAQPLPTLSAIATRVGRGGPVVARAQAVARLVLDREVIARHARAQCDTSVRLAELIGLSGPVCSALAQVCERFDGLGAPHKAAGEAIAAATRCLHVADVAEVSNHRGDRAAAIAEVERRAGHHLDPRLARVFLRDAEEILETIAGSSVWERFLAIEPAPAATAGPDTADAVAFAFACFADLKSVFTLGHSPRVAQLACAAGAALRLPEETLRELRAAALLHDLGRVTVPTGIWDKPGPLGAAEWERVRLHAYYTERILVQAPAWAGAARLASAAHERSDGSGYPRAVGGLALAARLLAAADVMAALGEPRPHRPARTLEESARVLAEEVAGGRLDRAAVDAVLSAAGAPRPVRAGWPRGLSEREVEVLRLVARGKTNKEIATLLNISARTVQNHVAHIYDKIGAYSRAGAALFVLENGLLD